MSHDFGIERRKFGRKDTSIEALAQAPGRPAVRCMIRNISQMGALVEFAAPFTCRTGFRLYVEGNRLDAQCQIRRQDGGAFGVEFVSIATHNLVPTPADLAQQAPLYEPAKKPELISQSGRDLRARLFGRPAAPATAPSEPAPAAATPELAAVS